MARPADVDLDDLDAVKRANPAPWIDIPGLRRQRAAVPETAFAQSTPAAGHRRKLVAAPGAWQGMRRRTRLYGRREDIWIGVDVGGERSATAVAWVNAELHVGAGIYYGDRPRKSSSAKGCSSLHFRRTMRG